ncbi:MAG: LTA synthase family protein [Flavobacteriales bacterium]|nr:LTA synthase family protein [Flavobacteriales bacterium]MCB9363113.1 LTA synthase family protein [Flavobacteriales bacterium]
MSKFQVNKSFYSSLKYIFSIYLLGVIIFFFFRLLLFVLEIHHTNNIPSEDKFRLISQAFIMGLRFDTVICNYILFSPTFAIFIAHQINLKTKQFSAILKYYFILLFSIAFLISGIDLSYFHQFFSRFSVAGLQWIDSPAFMFKMIFQEFSFWWVIFPIIISFFSFIKVINRITIKWNNATNFQLESSPRFSSILISILFLGLVFIGIRGRFESKSPIRVGTAYFSNYAFINQLGLNPTFTYLRSYLDAQKNKEQTINIIDDKIAIANTQKYLNRTGIKNGSPIAKNIMPDIVNTNPPNIILVLMESMSANKMTRFGNPDNLTPFLDSIANYGLSFDNIYSAGTHTFNGIYGTLFAMPALFTKHPMKGVTIPKLNGIGSVLKQHNYSTAYFTTHDDQFDNVGGFLRGNDFETIISQQNYPSEKVANTLGVPDDYMFEFSIDELNKLYKKEKPFLSVMMTASDHGPYYVPEYFTPKQPNDIKKQIVEYADWSIRKFIGLAKKQPWFENTIFAFVADHGALMETKFDVPLSYNHVPFIIYAPHLITTSKTLTNYGGQIDVFPTLMNLVALPYTNNTLGIDLLTEKRPYIYFCHDEKLGVIDDKFLYVYRGKEKPSLYKYNTDVTDYINDYPAIADSMKIYAISNMQTGQFLVNNGKTE